MVTRFGTVVKSYIGTIHSHIRTIQRYKVLILTISISLQILNTIAYQLQRYVSIDLIYRC